jgi:predicted outer membrane lipoprotein
MIKQKISLLLLAVAMFGIIGAIAVEAYEVADRFQSPSANYVKNKHNRFREYLSDSC